MQSKNISILVMMLLTTACASMMNPSGAMQPVTALNANEQIYHTSCSGSVEEWGSCFKKAADKCTKGYNVMKKVESPVGGKREITFQCNP